MIRYSSTRTLLIALIFYVQVAVYVANEDCIPKQIHISLGESYTRAAERFQANMETRQIQLRIIYHTKQSCSSNRMLLTLGAEKLGEFPATSIQHFVQINATEKLSYESYVNVHELTNLKEGVQYEYSFSYTSPETDSSNVLISSRRLEKSETFTFTLPVRNATSEQSYLFFADFDDTEYSLQARTALLNYLESRGSSITALLPGGDLAYNLETENGRRGDRFMEKMQPIFARWPTMPVPGNHERLGDYANYNSRFKLPLFNQTHNNVFSFDVGPIHFLGLNTDRILISPQYRDEFLRFVEQDLEFADMEENRRQRPWIVVYNHRPFYTASRSSDVPASYPILKQVEDLLYKYNVDLGLFGHVHYYERSYPIYQNQTYSFEGNSHNMKNAKAPIYVIDGILGSNFTIERMDNVFNLSHVASSDNTTGFGELKVLNNQSLLYIHRTHQGKVIDQFVLSKSILRTFDQKFKSPDVFKVLVFLMIGGFLISYLYLAIRNSLMKRGEKTNVSPENIVPSIRLDDSKL